MAAARFSGVKPTNSMPAVNPNGRPTVTNETLPYAESPACHLVFLRQKKKL
jgi:hypothetical protein